MRALAAAAFPSATSFRDVTHLHVDHVDGNLA